MYFFLKARLCLRECRENFWGVYNRPASWLEVTVMVCLTGGQRDKHSDDDRDDDEDDDN